MSKPRHWLFAAAGLALALYAGFSAVERGTSQTTASDPAVVEIGGAPSQPVWSHGHSGAGQNAEEHWRKHGGDFPEFHSAAEYERGALHFVQNPPSGTLIKHRSNGDTLFYDPNTNTFAVVDGDGEPRTFFRPDSGRAYWEGQ